MVSAPWHFLLTEDIKFHACGCSHGKNHFASVTVELLLRDLNLAAAD